MDFCLEDQEHYSELRKSIREFVAKEIEPLADHVAETGEYPEKQLQAMKDFGLTGIGIPEEYGGKGWSMTEMAIVTEEIAKSCPSCAVVLQIYLLGTGPLMLAGSEEQKRKYLPLVASGKKAPGFAITEASAGTDAAAIEMTAVKDGDEWVLNGKKTLVGNFGHSDFYFIFAKTDPEKGGKGITGFIVDTDNPGFKPGITYKKMGILGQRTGEFELVNCRVKEDAVLGEINKGYGIALGALDGGRIQVAAQSLGVMARAIEEAKNWCNERKVFGTKLGNMQYIQFKLADMVMKYQAAKLLCYRAAILESNLDKVERKQKSAEVSIAKLFASEAANQVCFDATQIMGGRGVIRGNKCEQLYRDARVYTIFEGSSEVQKMVIGRSILDGSFVSEV